MVLLLCYLVTGILGVAVETKVNGHGIGMHAMSELWRRAG